MPKEKEDKCVGTRCGRKCKHCHRRPFMPENPRTVLGEVMEFVAGRGDALVTSRDVSQAFGMSPEDASNRLRYLRRYGRIEVARREGRRLFYRLKRED